MPYQCHQRCTSRPLPPAPHQLCWMWTKSNQKQLHVTWYHQGLTTPGRWTLSMLPSKGKWYSSISLSIFPFAAMCNSCKWVGHQNNGISDIILGHFQTLIKMSQQNLHLSARVLYEGKVTESLVKFAAGKLMSQLVHNFKSFSTGTALWGQSNHPHTAPRQCTLAEKPSMTPLQTSKIICVDLNGIPHVD